MRYNHVRGIKHIIKAFSFSMAGFRAAWVFEEAFRIEILLFIVLAPLGLWLGETPVQKAILIGSLFLVIIIELINSAIEAAIDRISEEHHLLSARAKDIGSAAVFIALLNVITLWGLILIPKFI